MGGFYFSLGDGLRWLYDHRIDTPAVLDTQRYFPNAQRFAAVWQSLRDEALAVGGELQRVPRFHEIMPEQTGISANDGRDWRMYMMKAYGHVSQQNLARCPTMAALLEDCPEVLSATYSFLAPGKHVPEHRGPFRGVLRFHLGLSMPRDANGNLGAILWIDHKPHLLDNGECLLWDDTYPHELLNTTDQVRAVLLLDVWRPKMPADMKALSSVIVGGMRAVTAMNEARANLSQPQHNG
ncbi:MAG: aspartyl/asparaginyl beta-hydroxylase domain-containing protein [Alphaproteobacteria bacterium]